MGVATAVSFFHGMAPLSLAPMFPYIVEAFKTDLPGAIQFTGVSILVLGFSNFIWYLSRYSLIFPSKASSAREDLKAITDICQGPYHDCIRTTSCHSPFNIGLSRQHGLESGSKDLWKLHGRLCFEWNWRWSRRGMNKTDSGRRS